MFTQFIISLCVLLTLTSASAAEFGRRSFLKTGALATFFGMSPEAPALPPSVTPSLTLPSDTFTRFRASQLIRMFDLSRFAPRSHAMGLQLDPIELEIMRDWQKQKPMERAFLDHEIESYQNFFEALIKINLANAEVYRSCQRRKERLLALVTDRPWSTFDWSRVYASRISEMEASLARELRVDVSQVYQLLENVIAQSPEVRNVQSLIQALSSSHYSEEAAPIYSQATIDKLLRAAAEVSTTFAETLRLATDAKSLDGTHIRYILAAPELYYAAAWNLPLKFSSPRYAINGSSIDVSAEDLAREYLPALNHFALLKERFVKLAPSPLRDLVLRELPLLEAECRHELLELPKRLSQLKNDKDRANGVYKHSRLQNFAPDPIAHANKDHDLAAALQWGNVLRSMHISLESLAEGHELSPTFALARECEPLLLEAPKEEMMSPTFTQPADSLAPIKVESSVQ